MQRLRWWLERPIVTKRGIVFLPRGRWRRRTGSSRGSDAPEGERGKAMYQGEAVQADSSAEGSARDVPMLNWRTAAAGEPREQETLMRGSEAGRQKSAQQSNSLAA